MRADERQAAVAYTYAWWLTEDDDAAAAVVQSVLSELPPGDGDVIAALITGVRRQLGDLRPLPGPSELALLHDGLGVKLETAGEAAAVQPEERTVALASGRLEALLETVRERFDHPERLGGLAVGDQEHIAHARGCPSCARARTLIERGRTELREVVAVSAAPGLLAQLVAEPAPAEDQAAPEAGEAQAPESGTEAELGGDADDTRAPESGITAELGGGTDDRAEPEDVAEEEDDEDSDRRVATTPARRQAATVLAGAGLVTLCVLVAVLIASGGSESPQAQAPPVATEDPAVSTETEAPLRPEETETAPPQFGPPQQTQDFTVVAAGLIIDDDEGIAPSGAVIAPDQLIRIAVEYRNATEGVELAAVWRIDGEEYQRLRAVVSGRSSRHVWGVPTPPEGWPPGRHRIVITADGSVVAAVDFNVQATA